MGKKAQDLTGKTFERLTVVEPAGIDKFKARLWLCNCSCGKQTIVPSGRLINKITRSCGCLKKELDIKKFKGNTHNRLNPGSSGFVTLYTCYKGVAKRRGFEWNLTKEEAKDLFQANCYYCGISPKNKYYASHSSKWSKEARENSEFVYNGIDRKNNTLGYFKENVVTCCEWCNKMKLEYSVDEFIQKCRLISERFK